MPSRPLKPCKSPGCPELVVSGCCDRHKQQKQKQHTKDYGQSWKRQRDIYLVSNPFCSECDKEGVVARATVVTKSPPRGLCKDCWIKESSFGGNHD